MTAFRSPDGDIRFGLAAVKGVGRSFMKQLVDEREKNGIFTSFQDFCERMYDRELNRRALECLIKAGAFDSMGCRRSQLLRVAGPVVDAIAQNRKKNIEGQMDLFGMGNDAVQDTQIALPDIPEVSKRELLAMEKETTGLYLSGHPMDEYRELAARAKAAPVRRIIDDLSGESAQPVYRDGMTVRLACVVTAVKLKSTKNGSMMAYVTVEDDTAAIELVVFPKALQQCGAYLTADSAVLLTGTHRRARGGGAQGAAERGAAAERGRGKRAHDCGKAGRERIFRRGSGEKGAAQAVYPSRQPEGRQMARHPRGALDLSRRHAGLSVSARHEENDACLAPPVVPAGRKHFAKITLPLERG